MGERKILEEIKSRSSCVNPRQNRFENKNSTGVKEGFT